MNIEYNPPILISHSQTEQPFRIKNTIENPNFFAIDKISNDYITTHNEKNSIFLNKCGFKLIFNSDFSKSILIETVFQHNSMFMNLKRFFLYHIDIFIDKGYIFSHINEMNITSVIDKMYITYNYYITCPMPMVERRLNMIIAKNPHLIKSLNIFHIHPLIRKYSYIR